MARAIALMIITVIALGLIARCDQSQAIRQSRTEAARSPSP